MTKADLHRFVDDLEKDGDLLEAVKPKATGLAALVAAAKEHGYEFTLDEAKTYIQSRSPGDPNVKGQCGRRRQPKIGRCDLDQGLSGAASLPPRSRPRRQDDCPYRAEAVVTVVAVVV